MRALAPWLGFLLFCNWVLAVVGFRLGMEMFADFKIQMPTLTLWTSVVTGTLLFWPVTALVALSNVLLALRIRIGWWLGFAVCLLCDLTVFSYVLPMIALVNGLGGADEVAFLPVDVPLLPFAPESLITLGPTILLVSFGFTQFIFAALLFRRHDLIK